MALILTMCVATQVQEIRKNKDIGWLISWGGEAKTNGLVLKSFSYICFHKSLVCLPATTMSQHVRNNELCDSRDIKDIIVSLFLSVDLLRLRKLDMGIAEETADESWQEVDAVS